MPVYTNESDGALVCEFGRGDILVCRAKTGDELVLVSQPSPHQIGDSTTALDGISTDALPPGHRTVVRLVFRSLASLRVVIEELRRIEKDPLVQAALHE